MAASRAAQGPVRKQRRGAAVPAGKPETKVRLLTEGDCEITCVDPVKLERAARSMRAPESVAILAETFRVLGDPTRLRIMHALSSEELCVCDLANLLEMSQSAVSHSLRALRQMRLVRFRKEGKIAYYSLDDDHIASLISDGFRHVEEHK